MISNDMIYWCHIFQQTPCSLGSVLVNTAQGTVFHDTLPWANIRNRSSCRKHWQYSSNDGEESKSYERWIWVLRYFNANYVRIFSHCHTYGSVRSQNTQEYWLSAAVKIATAFRAIRHSGMAHSSAISWWTSKHWEASHTYSACNTYLHYLHLQCNEAEAERVCICHQQQQAVISGCQ